MTVSKKSEVKGPIEEEKQIRRPSLVVGQGGGRGRRTSCGRISTRSVQVFTPNIFLNSKVRVYEKKKTSFENTG